MKDAFRLLEGEDERIVRGETQARVWRDHFCNDTGGWPRDFRCHLFQFQRVVLQRAQIGRRHGFAVERRPSGDRVKKGGTETINIAAKIFRLIIQPFRRDVIRRAPDGAASLHMRLGNSCQTEITDLRHPFFVEQNIGRFDVAMDQPFLVSRA